MALANKRRLEAKREREQLLQISKAKRVTWTVAGTLLLAAIGVAAAVPAARVGLYFASVALAGVLLGKEVTTSFVITPAARSLSVPGQVALQQALARPFRNIGPPVFNLTLITGIALSPTAEAPSRYFLIAGSTCIVLMLAVVFKVSVPINFWTEKQTSDVDPVEWVERRRRWDRAQIARLVLDGAALACFLLGLLARG